MLVLTMSKKENFFIYKTGYAEKSKSFYNRWISKTFEIDMYVIWNDDNSFPCISKMNEVIFSQFFVHFPNDQVWVLVHLSLDLFFYVLQYTSVTPVCSVHSSLLWAGSFVLSLHVLNMLKTLGMYSLHTRTCMVHFLYQVRVLWNWMYK